MFIAYIAIVNIAVLDCISIDHMNLLDDLFCHKNQLVNNGMYSITNEPQIDTIPQPRVSGTITVELDKIN